MADIPIFGKHVIPDGEHIIILPRELFIGSEKEKTKAGFFANRQ